RGEQSWRKSLDELTPVWFADCRRGVPTGGRDSSVPNETPPRQSRAAGGWRWVIPGAANPSLPISIGDSQMKTIVGMSRTCLLLIVLTSLGVGGAILAQHVQHTGKGEVKVTQLSQRDIIEKLDGKAASATAVEVTFEPGQKDTPHRHAGPVFGYVLEGEYAHAINDEPVKTYKTGDTFYEPSGRVHRVARNPSKTAKTRLLAVILHPRDAKEVTVPEKGKE